jgi:O-antigen/teichoic acid export membrane protein
MDYDRIEDRHETEPERHDRQLNEVLQELRVVIPGTQVLFAFLLTVPFTARFAETTDLQRDVYFATLLCTAVATALFMAPSAVHRLRFKKGDKRFVVAVANALTIAGLAVLMLAVTGAVFVVSDVMFDVAVAGVAAGAVFALMMALWWILPLTRRLTRDRRWRG